ncbi:MAG TPA: zinc ribbon domain-containing protein [Candidatus Acidoferrales bacterium]|nr:zinc ribbon domain-containing protein [Candidatus Acidoferrales bacterium]
MYCDQCGKEAASDAKFCSNCGRAFSAISAPNVGPAGVPPVYYQPGATGRLNSHLRTLGILWLICGVLRTFNVIGLWFIGRMVIPSILSSIPGISFSQPLEHLIRGGIFIASGFLLFQAALALVTAWGLLERQSWGRIIGIVAGILALLRIPFGTALGIYTLWVLLPAASEIEYRSLARA